jgi:hypothetical protein
MRADVKVATADLRKAFKAVKPHGSKVKTGDDQAEYRVRLVFSTGWLFVCASNGASTGLAKVQIVDDSRGRDFAVDDGPMVVDLQPRRVPLIMQQFKAKPGDPSVDQLIEFTIDLDDDYLDLTDIGGLWSEGESVRYPIDAPNTAFPDVIGITSKALANIGATSTGKALVTDSRILALFKDAGEAYDAPLQIEATGSAESRGFVVSCGSHFLGTLESRHNDDDSLKKRNSARMAWLELIPARKLEAV